MSVDLLTFTFIFIPVALIIGLASATIGYTAWGIVVPLVFVVFGFDLYDALFMSVFIDLIDSFFLTILYGKKDRVDFRSGGLWSIFSVIGGIIGFILSEKYLAQNSDLLKGSVGYVIIALGMFFLYKGYNLKKQAKNVPVSLNSGKPANLEVETACTIEEASEAQTGETPSKETAKQEKDDKKPPLSPAITYAVLIVGMLLSGGLSGLIGLGSGTNYVLLFMFALGWNLQKSTGTGVFMMFVMMLFCSIAFGLKADVANLLPYLAIASSFSLIGTSIGCYYAFKLSEDNLHFLVGSTMILAATVATVQTFII